MSTLAEWKAKVSTLAARNVTFHRDRITVNTDNGIKIMHGITESHVHILNRSIEFTPLGEDSPDREQRLPTRYTVTITGSNGTTWHVIADNVTIDGNMLAAEYTATSEGSWQVEKVTY